MLAFSSPADEMNFSKHWCPGQEWRRLLEAAKRTVSRSFLCLVCVVLGWQIGRVSAFVQLPSLLSDFSSCLSFFLSFFLANSTNILPVIIVITKLLYSPFRDKGSRLEASSSDGFQTLWVLMILSAGQQKGHPSRWRGLPLRRGCSSCMVRARSECRCVRQAEIEEAPDDGKWGPLALPKFR